MKYTDKVLGNLQRVTQRSIDGLKLAIRKQEVVGFY
jgi:hypothetical protein